MAFPLLTPLITAAGPVGTAATRGVGAGAITRAVPAALASSPYWKSESPYAAGFLAGAGQVALGGGPSGMAFNPADLPFAATQNIERFGGPALGFGASAKGTKETLSQIPGTGQAQGWAERTFGGIQGSVPTPASVDIKYADTPIDPDMFDPSLVGGMLA